MKGREVKERIVYSSATGDQTRPLLSPPLLGSALLSPPRPLPAAEEEEGAPYCLELP